MFWMLAFLGGVAGCNVELLPDNSRPAVVNSCNADKDCGTNGICTNGACYSRSGTVDEVLLQIAPEASSPLGGISFLSMQEGLRRGDRARAIALSGPVTFTAQVQVNGEDLAEKCPYLHTGKPTVAARITYTRMGAVGGVSVAGLSNGFTVTVDTQQDSSTPNSVFTKDVSLVPGIYDIYAQPVASANCQIAPKLWRGVEVALDGDVVAWAPPATLELPRPRTLGGTVQRPLETLADWQVEIVDPQDEKVISSSARLGATTKTSPVTNFEITYQPLELVVSASGSKPGNAGELIRLKPPKNADSTVSTVYFDLAATDFTNSGQVDLILSSLPTSAQLVTVSGQVHGDSSNDGVRATVKFLNITSRELVAAFGPTVTTDAAGRYTTKLFPGEYRIVVVPEGASDDGSAVAGANPARQWALTKQEQIIGSDVMQVVDLTVERTRSIEGVASAGAAGVPAQGATLEAAPFMDSSAGVLGNVISPPISPARASVPVDDTNGKFTLVIDPGLYDLSLKPAAASNFAWWILPKVSVAPASMPGLGRVDPQLLYPVPLEGTITVTMQDKTSPPTTQPLRNATVQAYARSPRGSVIQVGIARTDDMGRYRVALPPGFASLQ
jgi:hypothetical protein